MKTRTSTNAALAGLLLATILTAPAALAGDGEEKSLFEQRIVIDRLGGDVDCDELEGREGFRKVKRAFLGVELTELTPELRRHFGVPEDAGVMIGQIVDGSAAYDAGLQVGDIITLADGRDVEGGWDVSKAIRDTEAGSPLDLEYWREGKMSQTTVTLGEKESCQFDISVHLEALEGLEGLSELDFSELENIHVPVVEISQEALEQAREALSSIDWTSQLEQLREIELEGMDVRMEELRVRMEELHERMAEENERLGREIEVELREKMKTLESKERVRLEKEIRVQEELRRAQEARMKAEEKRVEAMERARAAEEAAKRELEEELARARAEAAEGGGGNWV